MTKEPWKRAAQLSRQKYRPAGGAASPPSGLVRPRMRAGCIVGWLTLILVIGGTAALYFTRGLWLARYSEELPRPVVDVIKDVAPEPRRDVDWRTLERGLGADLIPFTDYLLFVGKLGDWNVTPRLVETGSGTWQVRAPGVVIYVQQGVIFTYNLDLEHVFRDDRWEQWWPALKDANLTPDLTWTALTGDSEMPVGPTLHSYRSDRSTHLSDGWVYPVYTLHFQDGWLRQVELEVEFGVSDESAAPDR